MSLQLVHGIQTGMLSQRQILGRRRCILEVATKHAHREQPHRMTMRNSVFGGKRIRRRMRTTQHRILNRHPRIRRPELHLAARLQISWGGQHPRQRMNTQAKCLSRKHLRECAPLFSHCSFQRVDKRVDSGANGHSGWLG